jgi:transcriptional regulatory protein LevR
MLTSCITGVGAALSLDGFVTDDDDDWVHPILLF